MLPAIEQFGEGMFVHFDEAAIREWLEQDATRCRHDELITGYRHWCMRFSDHAPHARLRSIRSERHARALRDSRLHGDCRCTGHAGRSGRNSAEIYANPRGRIGTINDMFERSDLRRSSTGPPRWRPRDSWRRLPWLPRYRGDELRDAESLFRQEFAGTDDGDERPLVLWKKI